MVENEEYDEKEKPPPYENAPSGWLPKVSVSGDLGERVVELYFAHHADLPPGYIGFFPPRPLQDEDEVTEANIKNGFVSKPMPVSPYIHSANGHR